MTMWVALLRGVNVGAAKRMKMEMLRAAFTDAGFENVQTYLQSGNVVFSSAESDPSPLVARIEAAIEKSFGFHSDVMLRTAEQMNRVLSDNPFADRPDLAPSKFLVLFPAKAPSRAGLQAVEAMRALPEEIRTTKTEIYIYYPEGMGRSKLTGSILEKAVGGSLTARNWNTVRNLAGLAKVQDGGRRSNVHGL